MNVTTFNAKQANTGKAVKLSSLAVAMLVIQSNHALAAQADFVKPIRNIAGATYTVNGNNSLVFRADSNQVQVEALLLPEYAVKITQPPIQTIEAGQPISWVNTLTNTGAKDETVNLTFGVPQTLSNFKVYQDSNNNGKVDEGEPQITFGTAISLKQGESLQLIFAADASPNLQDNDTAEIDITATVAENTDITATATDGLVVVAPVIEFKTPDYSKKQPSDEVGHNVYVQTGFAQCNLQPTKLDQVWVRVQSNKTGDLETFKGLETGVNTGKYRFEAPTQNNANAILGDRIIQTLTGDNLKATLTACISPEVNTGKNDLPTPQQLIEISPQSQISTNMVMMAPQQADLQVTKEGNTSTAELGDYVSYTITVKNTGNATAYAVNLKDTLPLGFNTINQTVKIDGKSASNFATEGKYQVLGLGDIKANKSKKVTYRVLIGATAMGGDGTNRATAVGKTASGATLTSPEANWHIDVSRGVMNTDGIIIGKVYNDINRDGIQQKQHNELGVAGVRIYMENGNYIVTDAEGKYNFYGISAKTHVLKVDRTTLPAEVELIEQSNRNSGDPASRFVDLRHGELHRADFAVVAGMSDGSSKLTAQLQQRSQKAATNNTVLEQAIKRNLELTPNYNTANSDSMDANGCKQNSDLDAGLNCEAAIINAQTGNNSANNSTVNTNALNVDHMVVSRINPPKEKPLETYLKDVADNTLKFINLTDGQQIISYQPMVQLQAPLGTDVTLLVNDTPVSEDKIGKRATQKKQQVAGYDYYAVVMGRGFNTLTAIAKDSTGKVIAETSIQVITPDSIEAIDVRTQKNTVTADGKSAYQLVVSLKDKGNRLYPALTPVTLDTNIGRVALKDDNPNQPGIQTSVTGGELLVPVVAPTAPGEGTLTIDTGSSQQKVPLKFTPELRPLIAVGIIEGNVAFKDFDSKRMSSASGDGFEQELTELSNDGDTSTHGRAALFLKGKVKGDYLLTLAYDSDKSGERLFRDIQPDEYYPVYGDASAKGFDAQSTSKFYIRLDKGRSFAMYGDIKTQIDHDEGLSLGQYKRTLTGFKGHYETDNGYITTFAAETATDQQVNETRGLGVSGPYPLAKNFADVRQNSETVDVIVRDANNTGVIISRTPLQRFADYNIDPISHSLYLKTPIASQDANGNPIYLRVTVEADQIGEKYWVGGIAGKHQLTDKLAVGASYVNSDNPLHTEALASVNAVAKLSDNLKLVTEVAHVTTRETDNNATGKHTPNTTEGKALRVEINYTGKQTKAKLSHNDADAGFVTAASPIAAGRIETHLEVSHAFAEKTAVKLDAIHSEEKDSNAKRDGVKASVEYKLTPNLVAEVGVRHYRETTNTAAANIQAATDTVKPSHNTLANDGFINQSAPNSVTDHQNTLTGTTVSGKLTAKLPSVNHSKVFVAYEQDVENSQRSALSIGGETALGNMGRLYARHDISNSLTGDYGLNNSAEKQRTVIGFDANYMKDGKIYSEYRMQDSLSARDAEAAIGLKNKWTVKEGLTVNTLFERVKSVTGNKGNESLAAGIGMEYLAHDNYKLSGSLEKRWANTSSTLLSTAGAAYRANDNVTLLAKNIFSKVDYQNGHRTINRFQVGAAYRDDNSNQLDMLSKLEYRIDANQTGNSPYTEEKFIASWHGNFHPVRRVTLTGHYAGKYTNYEADGVTSHNTAHATYIRGLYDINERWDAGVQLGSYWNAQSGDHSLLAGAEIGYIAATNFRVSAGYNFMGYYDEDLSQGSLTDKGIYLRMSFKFDEDLFKRKDSTVNSSLTPANPFGISNTHSTHANQTPAPANPAAIAIGSVTMVEGN